MPVHPSKCYTLGPYVQSHLVASCGKCMYRPTLHLKYNPVLQKQFYKVVVCFSSCLDVWFATVCFFFNLEYLLPFLAVCKKNKGC